jgi:hypothetical protein
VKEYQPEDPKSSLFPEISSQIVSSMSKDEQAQQG